MLYFWHLLRIESRLREEKSFQFPRDASEVLKFHIEREVLKKSENRFQVSTTHCICDGAFLLVADRDSLQLSRLKHYPQGHCER